MKGFSFSFSWKRLIGVTSVKQTFARQTGIPTTKQGIEKKIGGAVIKALFGKRK